MFSPAIAAVHVRTRTIASDVAGHKAIWFIVLEWVTGLRQIVLRPAESDFGRSARSRLVRALYRG